MEKDSDRSSQAWICINTPLGVQVPESPSEMMILEMVHYFLSQLNNSINQIKHDQDAAALGYIKKSIFWLHLWVGHCLFHQESLSEYHLIKWYW